MTRVYKILPRAEWDAAQAQGRFEGSQVDLRDGFIHLSTAAQATETARRHFAGQTGLVLLAIDAARFGAALKWEPSRGGELFPHLYGALECAWVETVTAMEVGADGGFDLGELEA